MIRLISFVFVALAINACSEGGFGTESSAELTHLEASEGTLSPSFSVTHLNYSLTVDPNVNNINLTAIALHDASTIRVNGKKTNSGATSSPISTVETPTTVAIRVTSPDELRTNTYRITVIVPGQEDQIPGDVDITGGDDSDQGSSGENGDSTENLAELDSLAVSASSIDQTLESDTGNYTLSVGSEVDSITINAIPNNPDASVSINHQSPITGDASSSIPIQVGSNQIPITVTSANGDQSNSYSLTVERYADLAFNSNQTINSPTPQADSNFGFSTALSGNWLAIGAPNQDTDFQNGGSVFLFQKSGDQWQHRQTIDAPAGGENDQFGYSIAITNEFLAIGSFGADNGAQNSGQLNVYRLSGSQWTHSQSLTSPQALDNGRFGYATALDQQTLAVAELRGVDGASQGGRVTLYELEDSQWKAIKTILTHGASDRFATNLALSGSQLAIGAFDYDGECKIPTSDPGEVIIYQRDNGDWSEQATLRADNGDGGDRFGFSVALSQDLLAVGAICEDSKRFAPQKNDATQAGSVYLFQRSGNQWTQLKQLKASDTQAHDLFGFRVQLAGETLIATAPLEDTKARDAGAAYVFKSANDWTEIKQLRAADGQRGDSFGIGLGYDGASLVISANQDGERNGDRRGKAYGYK